ncbi:hypothetical protein ES707_19224 [subsurface metagenome]
MHVPIRMVKISFNNHSVLVLSDDIIYKINPNWKPNPEAIQQAVHGKCGIIGSKLSAFHYWTLIPHNSRTYVVDYPLGTNVPAFS